MTRRTWTTPVACAIAAILALPAGAAEPTPTEGTAADPSEAASVPRHASVEIDTSDIGEEGPVVKRRVRERTDVVLRAAGVLPGRAGADDPIIHVDVDELVGGDPGYQFEMWVSQRGELRGERRRVECTLCTESEIVARVEETVTELLAQLDAVAEPAPPADEPDSVVDPDQAEPAADPSATTDDEPPRKGLGGLGKAGVALLSVGVAGVAVGAVLVALPAKVDVANPLYETTTRPPGWAVLGVGAAALISGTVMLIVDRRRARRPRATALQPTLGRGSAGLVWTSRF
jgi:hypothetical protein